MEVEEEWAGVPDFENYYEVSNRGRVRSKDRYTPNWQTGGLNHVKGVILKGRVNRGGYLQFTLSVAQKTSTRTAHRLVARAFIPNPDNLPLVLHGPGGKLDNSIRNLRWGTNSDNMIDKRRDGTDHEVNKTHCPQGHEYTPENTAMDSGARKCKTCRLERSRERYWRLRNEEIEARRKLGLPERLKVPRCSSCGRFEGKTGHTCITGDL